MRSILALLVLSYSVSALAQEESLFPELAAFSQPAVASDTLVEENIEEVSEETVVSNEEDLFQKKEELAAK